MAGHSRAASCVAPPSITQRASLSLRNSSASIAGQLLQIQLEDLGIDYVDERNAMIEAVTLDDVKRVATRVLGAAQPTFVTVGPDLTDNGGAAPGVPHRSLTHRAPARVMDRFRWPSPAARRKGRSP